MSSGEHETAGTNVPLGARPESDALARAVARARVMSALVGAQTKVTLGRYQVLERAGAGGMGVVYAAWDPELDRRVAIKLVRVEAPEQRERALAEGQALAKLAHPNIVAVHDVGVFEDQLYLVMEWIAGKNLRVYCRDASAREIVAAYRAAGEGLRAAHEANLVHRDVKPENIMVGDDGRVRVLDFGLARAEADVPSSSAGTPRYMAPEQQRGEVLTSAVDQYAFCTALAEAFEPDVPRWIAAITDRGTKTDPAARFPNMADLLHALARDPRTVWKRRALVAGPIAIAGAAFAIGTLRGDEVEQCTGSETEIASAYNTERIAAHLMRLGGYGVQVTERALRELPAYAQRWASTHRAACRANAAGELTPVIYTQTLGCLARTRAAFGAASEVLSTTTLERLPDAVVAMSSLPDASRCRDQATAFSPPPAQIAARVHEVASVVERARVLALAIDPRAIELAAKAAEDAAALAYDPLAGRALLVHGHALLLQQKRAEAIAVLDTATSTALAAGDATTATEAIARSLYAMATLAGRGGLPDGANDTIAAIKLAEPIARGLPPTGAFARSLFFNNVGTLRLAKQQRPEARSWFEKAMRVRPPIAGDTVELATISGNLGITEDDRSKRDAMLAQEGDELAHVVGADHPLALDARLKAAMFVENPARAAALLAAPCDRYRHVHPQMVEKIAQCAYEQLWLADERGDHVAMRDAITAITSRGSEAALAKGYALVLDGKPQDAARHMLATADELAGRSHAWSKWRAVDALLVAAIAADRVELLERAHALMAELPGLASTTFYQRRLARLRLLLAARNRDVQTNAAGAAEWYRLAGGYEAALAKAEALSSSR